MTHHVERLAILEPAAQSARPAVSMRSPLSRLRVASCDLPSDPAVVSTARSLVTRQLGSPALDEAAFATELIASELVTNAIRLAKAPVRLRLIRDRTVTSTPMVWAIFEGDVADDGDLPAGAGGNEHADHYYGPRTTSVIQRASGDSPSG